ncbi:50S ribosomal protein L24 [Thermoproteota archaeon]
MTHPNKSRKEMYNAPQHVQSSMIGSMLSQDLRKKYGVKSIRIRKKDGVKVLRGEYKGVEGKITKIFIKNGCINVEGVTHEKIAGGTIPIKIHSSNVMVTNLNMEDNLRRNKLDKKGSKGEN